MVNGNFAEFYMPGLPWALPCLRSLAGLGPCHQTTAEFASAGPKDY